MLPRGTAFNLIGVAKEPTTEELYGLSTSGFLYRIDVKDGTATFVV